MKYLDIKQVQAVRSSEPPFGTRSADGCGNKIPSHLEVQLADKRWRRVYTICWSNSGTSYVFVAGKPEYIAGPDLITLNERVS